MLFLFYGIAICYGKIKIIFAGQPTLQLCIVKNSSGKLSVRLADREVQQAMNTVSEFITSGAPTKLTTSLGIICGKPSDPGVVVCKDQSTKSQFMFHPVGKFKIIKADNGACLTKRSFDKATNGYYLNLSKCKNSPEQMFVIKDVYEPMHNDHDSTNYSEHDSTNHSEHDLTNYSLSTKPFDEYENEGGDGFTKYSKCSSRYSSSEFPLYNYKRTFSNYHYN